MTVKEIRALTGLTQRKFAEKYHIPFITVQSWEQGVRHAPPYVLELLQFKVESDMNSEKIKALV